jgi:hypothetical protein
MFDFTLIYIINYPSGFFEEISTEQATDGTAFKVDVFLQSGGNVDILLSFHGPLELAEVMSVRIDLLTTLLPFTMTDFCEKAALFGPCYSCARLSRSIPQATESALGGEGCVTEGSEPSCFSFPLLFLSFLAL